MAVREHGKCASGKGRTHFGRGFNTCGKYNVVKSRCDPHKCVSNRHRSGSTSPFESTCWNVVGTDFISTEGLHHALPFREIPEHIADKHGLYVFRYKTGGSYGAQGRFREEFNGCFLCGKGKFGMTYPQNRYFSHLA